MITMISITAVAMMSISKNSIGLENSKNLDFEPWSL